MRDVWTFRPIDIAENKKYLFECKDNTSETGHSLLVHVAATHAGIVNGNFRLYRPDRMQDACHQWVPDKGYAKPVLFGHDEKGSILGRVRTAKYIDESYKWAQDFPILKDSVFYKTGDKKVDVYKTVDWIVENLMPQKDYSGLGYIELGLNITNPDAIAKVMRDEYLTVSVGFKTDSAICSVCHTDWAVDDKCEHKLGDDVDKKPVFLISGNFIYEELSFVTFPADPLAGKISKDSLKDSLNRVFFMGLGREQQSAMAAAAGMKMTDGLMDSDIHHVEDTVSVKDLNQVEYQNAFEAEIKGDALTSDRALEMKAQFTDWKPETEDQKTRKRSLVSTLNAKIRKNGWADSTTPKTENDSEIEAALNPDTCTISDMACEDWSQTTLTDEENQFFADEEGVYQELLIEMDAAVAEGELDVQSVTDAKLSSEKRKGLSGGTFCGPNRSFPVPDCAHVTAARRLIGRAKVGDGTKSKILACVSRKSSSMGCGGSKDEVIQFTQVLTDAKLDAGNYPGEIIAHYEGLHGQYRKADRDLRTKMRMMHGAVLEKWHAHSQEEEMKNLIKHHKTDEITDNVQKVADSLGLKFEDGEAKKALSHLAALDSAWKAAEPATKDMIHNGTRALCEMWTGTDWFTVAKQRLETERDCKVIDKKEWTEKEEAINSLTDEATTLKGQVVAAKAASEELLKVYKKGLASQIVMYKIMTGNKDFKDLDKASVLAKVDEFSKRHVAYLRDTVTDIMSELKWNDSIVPPVVQAKETPTEDTSTVNDSKQLTEPLSADAKTEAELEAEKLQVQREQDSILRDRLRVMNVSERTQYLASLRYETAKTSKK